MRRSAPSLKALRGELDGLDAKLLALVARRLRLVERIGRAKTAAGARVFDRGRERQIFERARRLGRSLGLPVRLVERVVSLLLEASHDAQTESGRERGRPGAPVRRSERRRVIVVGGGGRMGRLFVHLFRRRGHDVDVLERGDRVRRARVARADVVMVAVPMADAERVVLRYGRLAREDALLCDVNSLKVGVCRALARSGTREALGTHPMFGPTVRSLRRQKVILCPVRAGPLTDWLARELGSMGAELVYTDPATHDRMMAVVQVLTHFGMMAMGRALSRAGVPLADTLAFMSPIYRLELAMVGRLFSQSPALYQEILMRNPAGRPLVARFVREARELGVALERGDRAAFRRSFVRIGRWFRGFGEEAMALSDHIIETVMSRP
jgi:chorismate mutase/prephenate dehydrogenase